MQTMIIDILYLFLAFLVVDNKVFSIDQPPGQYSHLKFTARWPNKGSLYTLTKLYHMGE